MNCQFLLNKLVRCIIYIKYKSYLNINTHINSLNTVKTLLIKYLKTNQYNNIFKKMITVSCFKNLDQ